MFRTGVFLIAALAAVLVVAGYASGLHRAADTLALGRPVFGALALGGVLVARTQPQRVGFAAVVLVALMSVAAPLLPQKPGGDIRVYSKNLLNDWADLAPLAADIRAQDVDAVLLQEVSDGNRVLLDRLADAFPHQHLCRFSGWSGIAVLSRAPFTAAPRCSDWRGLAAAPVTLGGARVWLVSAHVPWLWPYGNARADRAPLEMLETLDGQAVIAGDFNAFPWTPRVRGIARASGTSVAGPVRPTLEAFGVPLPIDLALAPGGGLVERRPRFGSDHFGIVADLSLDP